MISTYNYFTTFLNPLSKRKEIGKDAINSTVAFVSLMDIVIGCMYIFITFTRHRTISNQLMRGKSKISA